MVPDRVKKAIVEAVGLESFAAGWHTPHRIANQTGDIQIGSIWVVEINEYRDPVYVAGVHQVVYPKGPGPISFDTGFYKGVLLVPAVREPLEREFGGPDPLPVVDLEFPGQVYPALKAADLLPEFAISFLGDQYPREFKIHIYTPHGTAYYRYNSRLLGKYQEQLWEGIKRTIREIADAYDSDEIFEYFRNYHKPVLP